MYKRSVRSLKATLAAMFALVATSASANAVTFRLACPSAPDNPTCKTASYFAQRVGEESKGTVDIKVFPSGQLGKGKSAIQQMQAGIIDLVVEDLTNYANFDPDYNVISWGFTFRDRKHFLDFLDSAVYRKMVDALRAKQNIELIASKWEKLPRVIVSKAPIRSPKDLVGLKFRVPPIPAYIETWKTLGANPTQVPWSESFQALKTGVVDAMEAPLDSVVSQKFDLAAPYVAMTNHVFASMTLAMNEMEYSRLSDPEKKVVQQAAKEATQYAAKLADQSREKVRSEIKADGGHIIDIDTAPFAAKLKEAAYQQEKNGLWSKGLYDQIQTIK
jgi:tripartite ATP-independent transporter DctP family solute receptor